MRLTKAGLKKEGRILENRFCNNTLLSLLGVKLNFDDICVNVFFPKYFQPIKRGRRSICQ